MNRQSFTLGWNHKIQKKTFCPINWYVWTHNVLQMTQFLMKILSNLNFCYFHNQAMQKNIWIIFGLTIYSRSAWKDYEKLNQSCDTLLAVNRFWFQTWLFRIGVTILFVEWRGNFLFAMLTQLVSFIKKESRLEDMS